MPISNHLLSWHSYKMGHSQTLSLIFVFSIQLTVNVQYKFLPMTGFEPRSSEIGSDHSTNWATTTALSWHALSNSCLLRSWIQSSWKQLKSQREKKKIKITHYNNLKLNVLTLCPLLVLRSPVYCNRRSDCNSLLLTFEQTISFTVAASWLEGGRGTLTCFDKIFLTFILPGTIALLKLS